jgi:hypothetical protein
MASLAVVVQAKKVQELEHFSEADALSFRL